MEVLFGSSDGMMGRPGPGLGGMTAGGMASNEGKLMSAAAVGGRTTLGRFLNGLSLNGSGWSLIV
jgi:hypothetical protein